jgi:hypothetical protein
MKYGYPEKVKADVETLNEILSRQGSSLLIDVIAEHVGSVVSTFKLSKSEVNRVQQSLVVELKEAISERI